MEEQNIDVSENTKKTLLDDGLYVKDVFFRGKFHVRVPELGYSEIKRLIKFVYELWLEYINRSEQSEGGDILDKTVNFVEEYFEEIKDKLDQVVTICTRQEYSVVKTWPYAFYIDVIRAILDVNDDNITRTLLLKDDIKKKKEKWAKR